MKPEQDHNGGFLHSDLELLRTKDGSPTLRSVRFDSTYHSLHGAFQESFHVFLRAGLSDFLERFQRSEIRIFEMGFGTGINAWLTFAMSSPYLQIQYNSIEKFPIDELHVNSLGESLQLMQDQNLPDQEIFRKIHSAPWNEPSQITRNFTIQKFLGDIEDFEIQDPVDIIYYDAFGPGTQPELWDERITSKLFGFLDTPGCLVTYSAQGAFRRALVSSGFRVEKLQGPPGKRDMTRAWKEGPAVSV